MCLFSVGQFRVVSVASLGLVIVFIIFRPFDLGHFHWRRFIGGRDLKLK